MESSIAAAVQNIAELAQEDGDWVLLKLCAEALKGDPDALEQLEDAEPEVRAAVLALHRS